MKPGSKNFNTSSISSLAFSLASVLALASLLSSCQLSRVTRIVAVRHAEKAGEELKVPEGFARADELKRVLKNTRFDSVYSTNTPRTIHTVEPLADHFQLPVNLYPDNTNLIQRIFNYNKGKTLLVAGHTNTIPDLIRQCGCSPPFDPIPDSQFDNLFIITVQREKVNDELSVRCQLMHLKYGVLTN